MSIEYADKEVLKQIQAALITAESLYAVVGQDGGGFLAITDLRLLFSGAAGVVSLPYSRITTIVTDAGEHSLVSGRRITVLAGGESWPLVLNDASSMANAYRLIMRNVLQKESSGMSLRL